MYWICLILLLIAGYEVTRHLEYSAPWGLLSITVTYLVVSTGLSLGIIAGPKLYIVEAGLTRKVWAPIPGIKRTVSGFPVRCRFDSTYVVVRSPVSVSRVLYTDLPGLVGRPAPEFSPVIVKDTVLRFLSAEVVVNEMAPESKLKRGSESVQAIFVVTSPPNAQRVREYRRLKYFELSTEEAIANMANFPN